VLKISRFAGEALPMFRIFLLGPPPEIGRVRDVGISSFDLDQGFFSRSDDIGSSA
jgi:hypothetical protein